MPHQLIVPMMSSKDPKEQSQSIDLPNYGSISRPDAIMKEESKKTQVQTPAHLKDLEQGPWFDSHFPNVMNVMNRYHELVGLIEAQEYCQNLEIQKTHREKYYHKFLHGIKEKVFPLINDEIHRIVPDWTRLLTISDGMVCVHSLNVLYLVLNDTEFQSLPSNH